MQPPNVCTKAAGGCRSEVCETRWSVRRINSDRMIYSNVLWLGYRENTSVRLAEDRFTNPNIVKLECKLRLSALLVHVEFLRGWRFRWALWAIYREHYVRFIMIQGLNLSKENDLWIWWLRYWGQQFSLLVCRCWRIPKWRWSIICELMISCITTLYTEPSLIHRIIVYVLVKAESTIPLIKL